jgi:hypothetical protein
MNPGPAELVQLDHWAKLEQVPRLPDYLQLHGLPRLTVRTHRTDVPDRSVFFPLFYSHPNCNSNQFKGVSLLHSSFLSKEAASATTR